MNAQHGGDFNGWIGSNGGGPSSDPHCGYGSSFNAHLAAGGVFTMATAAAPSGSGPCGLQRRDVCCRRLSGGEVVSGILADDTHMKGSVTLRGSCEDPVGNPFEGELTIEFTVNRITDQP